MKVKMKDLNARSEEAGLPHHLWHGSSDGYRD